MPALAVSALPAAGASTASALGAIVGGLSPAVLAVLEATLAQPFQLGPQLVGAWTVMRDAAAGLLLAVLLYGVLRTQVGALVGLEPAQPWRLLPRLPVSAAGVALSLPLVRGLLAGNNALCAALLRQLPQGGHTLIGPLAGGLALTLLPAVAGIGPEVVALLVLGGVAALACFYVVRAAEIALLALLLPLAAALWVVPAASGVWRALLGELLVAVFVQSAQVVVLLVFAAGMGAGQGVHGAPWLWSLGALALLFRCRGLLGAAIRAWGELGTGPGPLISGVRTTALLAASAAERLPRPWARVRLPPDT